MADPTAESQPDPHHNHSPEIPPAFDPASITRPDDALLTYFLIVSAFTLIAFPFVFLPLYFKYKTLQYQFDHEGISMRWGLLWRQEINLTYRRIQDIHVTRGIIQRYLGLSSLSIQTASGSAGAEMTIVGIKNPEILRDFLYQKMRGAESTESIPITVDSAAQDDSKPSAGPPPNHNDEALSLLREIRDELHALNHTQPSTGGQENA